MNRPLWLCCCCTLAPELACKLNVQIVHCIHVKRRVDTQSSNRTAALRDPENLQ
jgi:hypothetical protein